MTDIERSLAREGIEFIRGFFQSYLDALAASRRGRRRRPHVRVSARTVETPFGAKSSFDEVPGESQSHRPSSRRDRALACLDVSSKLARAFASRPL